MPLDRMVIYQLRTPLDRPYQPPFGLIHQVDSFIALASFADGSCRMGECTLLPGHNQETQELVSSEYRLLARHGQLKVFLDRNQANPFITLPILTCLDPTLAKPLDGEIKLCPMLQWNHLSEIPERVAVLAGQGNKIAKVNLPPNPAEIKDIVRETIRAGQQCGLRFRYDAQGALNSNSAQTLVGWLDDATTELLEQPFGSEDWEHMETLYKSCPIPLLLDDSIRTARDVFQAADCADYIKLSLAKNGTPSRLLELIRQAREIGFKIILGDGAPSIIRAWLEGRVQVLAGLDLPGEMNGFRLFSDVPLARLFEATATGFKSGASLTWRALESILQEQCVKEYHVPTRPVSASCA